MRACASACAARARSAVACLTELVHRPCQSTVSSIRKSTDTCRTNESARSLTHSLTLTHALTLTVGSRQASRCFSSETMHVPLHEGGASQMTRPARSAAYGRPQRANCHEAPHGIAWRRESYEAERVCRTAAAQRSQTGGPYASLRRTKLPQD